MLVKGSPTVASMMPAGATGTGGGFDSLQHSWVGTPVSYVVPHEASEAMLRATWSLRILANELERVNRIGASGFRTNLR